tara:strand:+ start:270 stop:1565 length:1296 start_codon:yes stop_codon:yes gene_type:complete
MLESIEYSPDGYLYYCHAVQMYSKFTGINLLPTGIIDDEIITQCSIYLQNEPYNSGPVFPFFLLLGIIFKLGYFFNFFHTLILGPIYVFLCNRVISQIGIKQRNIILYLVIFSPVFIWLLIYPSTDLISSILILLAINYFPLTYKKFSNVNLKNGKYSGFLKTSCLFIFTLLFCLLCRPIIWIIAPLIVFYFLTLWALDYKHIKKRISSKNIKIIQFFYSKYFLFLISLLSAFLILSYFLYSKYHVYPFPDNDIQIPGTLFITLSPPAPSSLQEITHTSISEFLSSLINFQIDFFDLFKKLLILTSSIIQSLIFSLLSLSGFQAITYSYDELNIIRFLLTTYKTIFGLFINLPGIFIIFIEGIKALRNLKKEPIEFISNKNNIFGFLALSSIFYFLTLLITVGHIRYLLPVYPFVVIGSQIFWRRLISIKN